MNRELHLFLRAAFVTTVAVILLVGSVLLGVTVGAYLFGVLLLAGWSGTNASLLGVTTGVAGFLAGQAGSDHAQARLRSFLDPGPEDGGE